MTYKQTACRACVGQVWRGPVRHPELVRDGSALIDAEYWACLNCGLVRKEPRPTIDELRSYYETFWQYESQRPGYELAAEFIASGAERPDGWGVFPRLHEQATNVWILVGDGSVLDVGSKGDAMWRALRAAGMPFDRWEGWDPQPKDGALKRAWLGSGSGPSGQHSLVSATHVMEHVLFPDLFLLDLAALTADGGLIYLEVPSLAAGLFDVGLCDDLNRNHLWHFSAQALYLLATNAGLTVERHQTDRSLVGWPVERLLLRKRLPGDVARERLGFLSEDIKSEYQKAGMALYGEDPTTTALYGASHSYALLRSFASERVLAFNVYDRYRRDGILGDTLTRDPDDMQDDGIKRVWVTTRSYNSYADIKKDLGEKYPWLEVKSPYPSLDACITSGSSSGPCLSIVGSASTGGSDTSRSSESSAPSPG